MIKIIFFCFVFLTTFFINWLAEARSSIEINEKIACETGYYMSPICGSDGETYDNLDVLKCAQKKKYGQRINLQFKRKEGCWVFERYGVEPCTMFCILMVLSALGLAFVQILKMWRTSSIKKDGSTSKIMTA